MRFFNTAGPCEPDLHYMLPAAARLPEAPQLIAFASLSMPPKALRQLIEDTARAGGVVVFRGFPNNSMKEFSQALGKIVDREDDFAKTCFSAWSRPA